MSGELEQRLDGIAGFRIVTGDLARLSAFYREVLGFEGDGAEEAIGAEELRLLGLGGRGRRQRLRIGAQSLAIDAFDPPGRAYPDGSDAASLWFQHFALVVADMGAAYGRLREISPITEGGPQHLPASSGGVAAFKFRDPDGHPLELLQFPAESVPAAWRRRGSGAPHVPLGIDHSAISVSDADRSVAFYAGLGLREGDRSDNHGQEQERLDGLGGVDVAVVPMQPEKGTPHLELLGYMVPRGAGGAALRANDVAATRVVWQGARAGLIVDPDGHRHQVER